MNLPPFPIPDLTNSWLPAAERRIISDREQKRLAQATRAALADWVYSLSEVNPERKK